MELGVLLKETFFLVCEMGCRRLWTPMLSLSREVEIPKRTPQALFPVEWAILGGVICDGHLGHDGVFD